MKTILEWTAEILSCNGKPLMGFKCKNDSIVSENFSGSSMGSVLEKTNSRRQGRDLLLRLQLSKEQKICVRGLEECLKAGTLPGSWQMLCKVK